MAKQRPTKPPSSAVLRAYLRGGRALGSAPVYCVTVTLALTLNYLLQNSCFVCFLAVFNVRLVDLSGSPWYLACVSAMGERKCVGCRNINKVTQVTYTSVAGSDLAWLAAQATCSAF